MATVTRTRQVTTPKVDIKAQAGWCLKYVDDGYNAPARQARAIYSYNVEKRNGNVRTGDIPVGVWLVGFLNFTKGAYVDYGHVFHLYRHKDGRIEIHDSEVHSGARGVYNSIAELLRWFGAYAPQYLGYSLWIDGRQVAEEYQEEIPEPAPTPTPTPSPVIVGDRVTTSATHDAQNGLQLDLSIINDGKSLFGEVNSKGNAVLRREGDNAIRAAVPVDSLSKV